MALEQRKKEAVQKANEQAATFAKKGIPYGFSTLNAKPKTVKGNLQTMIENGLTKDQALAALTTNPNQLTVHESDKFRLLPKGHQTTLGYALETKMILCLKLFEEWHSNAIITQTLIESIRMEHILTSTNINDKKNGGTLKIQ